MRRSFTVLAALIVAAGAPITGCRRQPAATALAPLAWPPEDRCWWAPFRTALPPDSVAARFARAFATLGLSRVAWSQRADTAWAQAGPTVLAGPDRAGAYAARVVALRRGDSTFFRHFVAITPPTRGLATPADSANLARRFIEFCGEVGRLAQTRGTVPREPERPEAPDLWRRRP